MTRSKAFYFVSKDFSPRKITQKRKRNHEATSIILTNVDFLKLYHNNLQQLIHQNRKKKNFESFNYHLNLNKKARKKNQKIALLTLEYYPRKNISWTGKNTPGRLVSPRELLPRTIPLRYNYPWKVSPWTIMTSIVWLLLEVFTCRRLYHNQTNKNKVMSPPSFDVNRVSNISCIVYA